MKRTNPVNSGASSLRNASQPGRFLSLRMKTPPLTTIYQTNHSAGRTTCDGLRVPLFTAHHTTDCCHPMLRGENNCRFKPARTVGEICGKPRQTERFLT